MQIVQSNTFYFVAGDETDFLGLAVKNGGISVSINLGNGRLDKGIKKKNVRFDDGRWHQVIISRVAQQVNFDF